MTQIKNKKYSKLTLAMLYLFFVPLALDWAFTYINFARSGHTILETNPLFIALKGNHILFFLCMLCLSIFWYWLIVRKSGLTYKWILLSVVVWLLLARGIAIYIHILHIINPIPQIVAANSIQSTTQAKLQWYTYFVGLLVYLPIFLQWLTLKLFRLDYDISKKGDDK